MTRKTITVTTDQGEQIEHADIDTVEIDDRAGLLSLHRDGKPVAIYQRFAWHKLTSEEQAEQCIRVNGKTCPAHKVEHWREKSDWQAVIALAERIEHDLSAIKVMARMSFK